MAAPVAVSQKGRRGEAGMGRPAVRQSAARPAAGYRPAIKLSVDFSHVFQSPHQIKHKASHRSVHRETDKLGGIHACDEGPPSEGACARAAAVAAAASPVAHSSTAGTEAVACATAVAPGPVAVASAIATAQHKQQMTQGHPCYQCC